MKLEKLDSVDNNTEITMRSYMELHVEISVPIL